MVFLYILQSESTTRFYIEINGLSVWRKRQAELAVCGVESSFDGFDVDHEGNVAF